MAPPSPDSSTPYGSPFHSDLLPAVGGPHGLDDETSPTLAASALARFEFEPGRGNEGTKILMVEWEDEGEYSMANDAGGEWEVSWEGKSTTLSARDGKEDKLRRLYFLLPPGIQVPRVVRLVQRRGRTMRTNPLPAIFPPELGASARTAGKKGVLHTIWAKKRMSVLQAEIEQEMKTNGEGIGLEMAMQEKHWIEENFGVGPRGASDYSSNSPSSPRSPGGGRLADKLKGLKLGTSTADLSPTETVPGSHLLSPDMDDIAVSSFSVFHGNTSRPPRAVAKAPPSGLLAKQDDSMGKSRMGSLAAVAASAPSPDQLAKCQDTSDLEDDLFAVKPSPRSPDMTRSPFSLTARESLPGLQSSGKA